MKAKMTRMIAVVLAVLVMFSCAACRSSELDSTETGAATTAPSTQPTPSTTAPTTEPSAPEDDETTAPIAHPTEPETPDDTHPTEPEVPTEPSGPSEPETKNEYINNENTAFPEEGLAIRPKHVYFKNGQLVAECFVINAQTIPVINVEAYLRIENDAGIIAEGNFQQSPVPRVEARSYVVHTFVFTADCVLVKNAELENLFCNYSLSWNDYYNNYWNDYYEYKTNEVQIVPHYVRWENGNLVADCYIVNGLAAPIVNIRVNELTFSNDDGVIATASFGTIDREVQPGDVLLWSFIFEGDSVKMPNGDMVFSFYWNGDVSYDYYNTYFFNRPEVEAGVVKIVPHSVWWEDGQLKANCYIMNGLDVRISDIQVNELTFSNKDGVIASASFETLDMELYSGDIYCWKFVFGGDAVQMLDGDLVLSLNWESDVEYKPCVSEAD